MGQSICLIKVAEIGFTRVIANAVGLAEESLRALGADWNV